MQYILFELDRDSFVNTSHAPMAPVKKIKPSALDKQCSCFSGHCDSFFSCVTQPPCTPTSRSNFNYIYCPCHLRNLDMWLVAAFPIAMPNFSKLFPPKSRTVVMEAWLVTVSPSLWNCLSWKICQAGSIDLFNFSNYGSMLKKYLFSACFSARWKCYYLQSVRLYRDADGGWGGK